MTTPIITEVYCTLHIEGTHNWPDCPITEVDYLRVPHRHMFHVKAYTVVNHDDRDVEFICLKHRIVDYVRKYFNHIKQLHEFGAMSCEMIARELIEEFGLSKCEVNEDNENGAILTVR